MFDAVLSTGSNNLKLCWRDGSRIPRERQGVRSGDQTLELQLPTVDSTNSTRLRAATCEPLWPAVLKSNDWKTLCRKLRTHNCSTGQCVTHCLAKRFTLGYLRPKHLWHHGPACRRTGWGHRRKSSQRKAGGEGQGIAQLL